MSEKTSLKFALFALWLGGVSMGWGARGMLMHFGY